MHDPAQMPRDALEAEVLRLRREIGSFGSLLDHRITEVADLKSELEERTRDLEQARQRIAELEQERR